MSLDYSAVPRMPDGRTALETIESVAATSKAVRLPMGPHGAGGGGTMMWHIFGEGSGKPPLLLFHGGSGSWIHWIRNVLPLSQHYTVYAADLPGLGDSDPPDDVRDVWSVTHCVNTAVDALLPKDQAVLPHRLLVRRHGVGPSRDADARAHQAHRLRRRGRPQGHAQAHREAAQAARRRCRRRLLADEARRNLELLMLHDPRKIDGVAIYMQIMNTTRARTRSRDMGIAGVALAWCCRR